MLQDVENTSMYFLERDELWKTVKPYDLKFNPPAGFPKTNAVPRKHDNIRVEDIRGREKEFNIQKNGFELVKLEASLTLQDFEEGNRDRLAEAYFRPLADKLKSLLKAQRVQIFDYQTRKSHPEFPISTGEVYDFQQPSTILHVDTTPASTRKLVEKFNPGALELLKGRHQYVNVWKPLKGPVKSWPLAICDSTSVDPANDFQARDIVYPEDDVESFQVYYSAAHKFYYVSDQQTSEAWVMIQSDSRGPIGTPHTAFPNPWAADDTLGRESIEVRAMVFYGEVDGA